MPDTAAGKFARFYTVSHPEKHRRGYTVYRVTARIVSRNDPDEVEEIVVWKRYNDFKKLHKELLMIHRNLFRRSEEFPPFSKGTVFGRFEETVIEERRQCAEDLLQFSANIPALYNSRHVRQFFEGGDRHKGSDLLGPAGTLPDPLLPLTTPAPSPAESSTGPLRGAACIGEVGTNDCGGSGLVSSLTDSWTMCSMVSDNSSFVPSRNCDGEEAQADEAQANGVHQNISEPDVYEGISPGEGTALSDVGEVGVPRTAVSRHDSLLSMSALGYSKDDYLMMASQQIYEALAKEALGNLHGAFDSYKEAVDLLILGVQGDLDNARRDMVKKKTSQYLLHLEELSRLLQASPRHANQDSGTGRQILSSSPVEELKKLHIIGVVGKVLLVLDSDTDQTFVVKGLRKCSQLNGRTLLVSKVPFMVRLLKYYSTEDSIFLLLEYAPGGKLWSYIRAFVNRTPHESEEVKQEATIMDLVLGRELTGAVWPGQDSWTDTSSMPFDRQTESSVEGCSTGDNDDDDELEEDDDDTAEEYDERIMTESPSLSLTSGEKEIASSYAGLFQDLQVESADSPPVERQALEVPSAVDSHSPDSLFSPISLQAFAVPNEVTPVSETPTPHVHDTIEEARDRPLDLFRIDSKDSSGEVTHLAEFGIHTDVGDEVRRMSSVAGQKRKTSPELDYEFNSDLECWEENSERIPVISFEAAAQQDAVSRDIDLDAEFSKQLDSTGSFDAHENPIFATLTGATKEDEGEIGQNTAEADVLEVAYDHKELVEPIVALEEGLKEDGNDSLNCMKLDKKMHELQVSQENFDAKVLKVTDNGDPCDIAKGTDQSHNGFIPDSYIDTADGRMSDILTPPAAKAKEQDLLSADVESSSTSVGDGQRRASTSGRVLPMTIENVCPSIIGDSCSASNDKGLIPGDGAATRLFRNLEQAQIVQPTCTAVLPESHVRSWAAEIILALQALHKRGIICVDLNPNNVLLDDRGHIRLTYFVQWSENDRRYSRCAHEEFYCAPEVGGQVALTEACDWWSLGVILFELLIGKSLHQCHPTGITTHTQLHLPKHLSREASALLQQLLQFNGRERLGGDEIKEHPFFEGVSWDDLLLDN
uniref:ribosomal protein S6 kinase delta-1-like n=1 Tax=Myxine glutinosa TaxID=7769 RepID=UPI00358E192A